MASTPLPSGTSFPGSPSDGDWFLRTDTNITYYYNNSLTRWLSTDLKMGAFGAPGVTNGGTNATVTIGFVPLSQDIYVETFVNSIFIATTNDASHFWTCQLNKVNSANTLTNIASFDTSADTVATWTTHNVSVNALVLTASYKMLQAYISAKTSTPGAIFWAPAVTYRLAG